jgi:endonuclease/exonuclease/phosphatase family metal-dependent hydrolase
MPFFTLDRIYVRDMEKVEQVRRHVGAQWSRLSDHVSPRLTR